MFKFLRYAMVFSVAFTGSAVGQNDPETAGTLCTGEDRVIFSAVSQKDGKIVSICMAEGDHTTPSHLTYRFGRPGAVEYVYPAEAAGSEKQFTLRRYTRARTTYLKFEFTDDGSNFEILTGHSDDEVAADLRVVRVSDGKVLAEHALSPSTSILSLMELEGLVLSAPFDE